MFHCCSGDQDLLANVDHCRPTLLGNSGCAGKSHNGNHPALSNAVTVRAAGRAANDLQEWFEVLPPVGRPGWLGGDSVVSVVIGGGTGGGRRVLWVFADTFVAEYAPLTKSRIWDDMAMPNSTVAIVDLEPGKAREPRFLWREGEDGRPVSFFEPTSDQKADGQLLWPVSGISSRLGDSVVLLCQRIKGFLNVVGTTVIVIRDVDQRRDPLEWAYTSYDIGSVEHTWFSCVFHADPQEESSDDHVYVMGHAGDGKTPPNQLSPTVLARTTYSSLLGGEWESSSEYWSAPGMWKAKPDDLMPIGLPSWETTCEWSEDLGLWYSFNIPAFSTEVYLYTAEEITGDWFNVKVFDIPAPFTSAPWINYAAKSHQELGRLGLSGHTRPRREGKAELVFSFVSNALEDEAVQSNTGGTLFGMGQMEPWRRGYWPRFVRVTASRASCSDV